MFNTLLKLQMSQTYICIIFGIDFFQNILSLHWRLVIHLACENLLQLKKIIIKGFFM